MGTDSLKPKAGHEYQSTFELEHYQRPIEDYFNTLTSAGFSVQKILEPPLNKKILEDFPGYSGLNDAPIGLIFKAIKTR